jgi:hypothetical protein
MRRFLRLGTRQATFARRGPFHSHPPLVVRLSSISTGTVEVLAFTNSLRRASARSGIDLDPLFTGSRAVSRHLPLAKPPETAPRKFAALSSLERIARLCLSESGPA